MIRSDQSKATPIIVPVEQPPPSQSITEFLASHTPEELNSVPDATLQQWLAPYFPAVRKSVLPTEKISRKGAGAKATQEYMDANMAAIEALFKSRGLKI